MKRMIINILSVFVIVLGSAFLTLPESSFATAEASYSLLASKCSCDNGDTCEGPCCNCTATGCSAGDCEVEVE